VIKKDFNLKLKVIQNGKLKSLKMKLSTISAGFLCSCASDGKVKNFI
jgi:hypothetical protein